MQDSPSQPLKDPYSYCSEIAVYKIKRRRMYSKLHFCLQTTFGDFISDLCRTSILDHYGTSEIHIIIMDVNMDDNFLCFIILFPFYEEYQVAYNFCMDSYFQVNSLELFDCYAILFFDLWEACVFCQWADDRFFIIRLWC